MHGCIPHIWVNLFSQPLLRSSNNLPFLDQLLQNCPDVVNAKCLSNGFRFGFELNYKGDRKRIEYKNMLSTDQFVNEIQTKVNKEIQLGRVLGLFHYPIFPIYVVTPLVFFLRNKEVGT